MRHTITWFEIPASNFDRAVHFYEQVLTISLKREVFSGMPMAVFPSDTPDEITDEGVRGAVIFNERRQPSANGSLVYLDAMPDLEAVLGRVPAAGGAVVMPKTDIGAPGFIALIKDTEGNVVGLHVPRN